MSLDSAVMMTIKEKLLWSVSSKEFSVMLKPAECAILLKEVWELEEPTGTVDIRRREYVYDSDRPRALASEPPRTLAINPGDPNCSHIWTGVTGRPDWDAGQCTLCGAIQTNATIARRRYSHDQEHGKSYEWQGDPGDETD